MLQKIKKNLSLKSIINSGEKLLQKPLQENIASKLDQAKNILLWPILGRSAQAAPKKEVVESLENLRKLSEDRVQIGCNYNNQSIWKLAIGVPLIYAPLFTTIPFMGPCIFLVKTHLKLVGGMNIKSFWDFVPDWATHRYDYNSQIVLRTTRSPIIAEITKTKLFWLFNCKLYCPLSVATFSYVAYLVKIVENWWCPFDHNLKDTYKIGAIDQSFWHVNEEIDLLDPEDRDNPIWNDKISE